MKRYFFITIIIAMFKRFVILLAAFFLWHSTQTLLTTDIIAEKKIIDRVHDAPCFRAINNFMSANREFTRYNFIITSLMIDVNVIYICLKYLTGGNSRSIFIFFAGLILRQICQFVNRLPTPANMIWFYPDMPSILVTYHVLNDFFFSGHTYVALSAGLEITTSDNYWIRLYGIFFIVYEIIFVLLTESHYFIDVYGAVSTYFMVAYFYDRIICSMLNH